MEYIPDKVHIDNNNNIYIIGIIVIVIIVLVCFFMNKSDSLPNIPLNDKVKEILNYSLMVHLDDEVSEKRLNDVKEIYKNYDLPINLFKATHWKNDRKELSKYPLNYIRITENNTRPGAYGLAGSFYKCLMKAYNENWSYLLFLEDDAVPILPPNQFNQRFNEVINTLPDNGSGIYNLGFHVYCKTSFNDNYKWIKSHDLNIYKTGTHCLLFGKNMIKIFTEYIKKNGIYKPIDHFINDFNIWYWYGDLSSNGMFRGLFKQLGVNCNNSQSLEGPINDSKYNRKSQKKDFTIIITASFIPSHPKIDKIKKTIESLNYLNTDNYDLILSHDYNNSDNYKKYLDNLHTYIKNKNNIKIIVRNNYGHLTGNIRNSISHVKTKYILIIQHDLPFIRYVNINDIISDMELNNNLKHVRFNRVNNNILKNSNWDNKNNSYGYIKYKNNYEYTSTDAWSDNNHLTTYKYYNDIVLKECPDGVPMEYVLNKKLKNKKDQQYYGTYVLGNKDYELPYINHIDGSEKWHNPNAYN
jgi:GR25 family glycosyltransferase involved in LPS biosynthesis